MIENINLDNQGETKKRSSPIELLFKYLSYLPLFILTIAISTTIGEIYVRYVVPKYKATTLVLVRGDDKSGNDILDNLFSSKKVNIENEIELIKSKKLIKKVVVRNNFNVKYYLQGKIKVSSIHNAPFNLLTDKIADSSQTFSFILKNIDNNGADLYRASKITKETKSLKHIKWEEKFDFNGNLVHVSYSNNNNIDKDIASYMVQWDPIQKTTNEILSNLENFLITSL